MKASQKALLFVMLYIMTNLNGYSQDTLFENVYKSFVDNYASNLSRGNDFSNSFRNSSTSTFSKANPVFVKIFQTEKSKRDSIATFRFLFDSVMNRFMKQDIWIDSPFNIAEQTNIMGKPLLLFCECLTPTYKLMLIKQDKSLIENGIFDSCFSKLKSDEELLKQLQQLANAAPPNKKINPGLFLERFLFTQCAAIREFELFARRSILEQNFSRPD
ncbi:hypothetical protein ESA94_16565 [Lacibacter luteus]|uniref:Uncharacterized protein n=1 Tax=Lacibacter luteus TaxID=2508719 RepID=A0A4Q1CGT4_9BACT|nr:hypothetical protein [Lacibacter luteus]RXK58995.1 hypothetical protein ESA94_16565 [Lacibacter luteus]